MFSGMQIANITRNQQGLQVDHEVGCGRMPEILNFNQLHVFFSIVSRTSQQYIHGRASFNCNILDLDRAAF